MNRILPIIVIFIISCFNIGRANTVRWDIQVGARLGDERIDWSENAYAYSKAILIFGTNIQYLKYGNILAPFISLDYHVSILQSNSLGNRTNAFESNHLVLSLGIQKTLCVGHSDIGLLFGIGYDWADYSTKRLGNSYSTDLNDYAYLMGVNLSFPFFNNINALFGYKVMYKHAKEVDVQDSGYILKTANFYHIVALGISILF